MTEAATLEGPVVCPQTPAAGPTISEQAAAIQDGIYFKLPMEVYLAVPRLGAGDLASINVSPGTFWRGSWLDPDRDEPEEDESKAFILGRAYHCARLEPDEFEKRFCRKPCREDFAEAVKVAGACWTGRDIEAALAELGQPKKHKDDRGVADQARRLAEAGYKGVIWPLEEARFQEGLEGRQPIEAKFWDKVLRDMERIRASEVAQYLEGGAAEVSVFWTDDNNIKRKARFDYLAPRHWADFKTFDNQRRVRLEQAIANAVRYNRYYITAASYREAAEAVRTGGLEVIGDATDDERGLIARIQLTLHEELDCWFVFQEKNGVPNLLARQFKFFGVPVETTLNEIGATDEQKEVGRNATRRATQLFAKAKAEIDYAKRMFVLYSQVYEPGRPWAPLEPVGQISDLDFNPSWLEGKYE